jgi:hypothetical protein
MTISRTSPITRLRNTEAIMISDAMPTFRYNDLGAEGVIGPFGPFGVLFSNGPPVFSRLFIHLLFTDFLGNIRDLAGYVPDRHFSVINPPPGLVFLLPQAEQFIKGLVGQIFFRRITEAETFLEVIDFIDQFRTDFFGPGDHFFRTLKQNKSFILVGFGQFIRLLPEILLFALVAVPVFFICDKQVFFVGVKELYGKFLRQVLQITA